MTDKITYPEQTDKITYPEQTEHWWRVEQPATPAPEFPFHRPDNTAVRAHLCAALNALGEHDCDSVRRRIEEAIALL